MSGLVVFAKTSKALSRLNAMFKNSAVSYTHLDVYKRQRLMSVSAADKAMPDNSYKPYQAYVYYGDYPLARSIYALLNDPRSALPWGFASFLASYRCV